MTESHEAKLAADVLTMLRCPVTGSPLRQENDELVAEQGGRRYPIRDGIAILLPDAGRAVGCDDASDVT